MKQFALVFLAAIGLLAAAGRPHAGPQDPSTAGAQEDSAASDSSVYTVTSLGGLRSSFEGGERVNYLDGGVRIDHATTTITSLRGKHYIVRRYIVLYDSVRVVDGTAVMLSDVGEYYGLTNTLMLTGRVRFSDRGWKARCDRAKYNRDNRVAVLTGNVSAEDSTRTMYADTIVYDRNREIADATGKVVIIDDVEDYSLEGRHARFNRVKKEALVDVRPVLTFDLKSAERGTVMSRIMRFDVDRKIGIAEGNVQMAKGETRASCDSAAIYDEEGRAELSGSPRATNGRSSMSGKRMLLWYNKDEVERVVLPETGRLAESPKPGSPWKEDSWIEGDSVAVYLSDEKVDSATILKNARAMYYPVEGDSNKVSNNYSTGDRMFFVFKDGGLDYIRISGASTGLYKYVNLAPRETIDSLAASVDSTLKFKSFQKSNERVQYNADRIEYFAPTENVLLNGRSFLKYQNSSLTAKRIDFNSRLNLLEATGAPVLEEKEQRMFGDDMGYDLDSEGGVIVDGSTKYGEGYYQGENIFKVGEDVLKVYNSTYTTCEYARPHYSFHADKMKVYINDKIVTGPIFLYIGKMPVFYLPYMVNSLRRTRSSGFLKPNFDIGIGSREGRFIQGLGYYWATNDYTDFLLTADFNERRNVRLQLVNNYAVRYVMNGSARFNYVQDFATKQNGFRPTNEWMIESQHTQTFSPSASFNGSLKFVSSDEAQTAIDRSEDVTRFVDRRVYSSGSFRKTWGGTNLSLSAARDQKLSVSLPTEARVSSTLPSFSLNFPQRSLWFGSRNPQGEQSVWERGLGSVLFTPKISATRTSEQSIARSYSRVSTGYSMGFNRQVRLGFFGLNPSVNMGWSYAKMLTYKIREGYENLYTASDRQRDVNEFSMSLGSDLSARAFGTFYPRIGPLIGIRHTVTPSVRYGFTPKLNPRQRESQSFSWGLDNSIDLKLKKGAQEIKSSDVLAWYVAGSYNPELPARAAFSDISSRSQLRIGNYLTFNLNNRYSPFRGKILSNYFGMSFNLTLKGPMNYPAVWAAPERERVAAALDGEKNRPAPPPSEGLEPASAGGTAGWSLAISYNLSEAWSERSSRTMQSNLRYNGSAQLSRGWRLAFNGYYNIEARDFTQQTYRLERDLHCWQASFVHERTGSDWRYYFEIAIKAHPEIKYERGTRAVQAFSGY
ncbi:MAG: putative LPS assembly protein LptD [Candidatus Krumholzibacteria bacterium]|nr:putative LPS assembly protein LptD [Candidatus Krumholzibacteria bacterium]